MSNELFEKVIRTVEVAGGNGGLLNAEQANKFIDYMWDSTVLGSQVRKITMRADTIDIDKVKVGQRIVRLATEAVDDGINAGATFTKVSLTTKKLRLDWELSSESLEDNIEGDDLEDHIARLMATQFGNDVEDLAINGDVNSTDPLLKSFDGYSKILRDNAHTYDATGDPIDRAVLNTALKIMPRNYMQRRNELKFFAGTNAIQDYLFSLQAVENGYVNPESLAAQGINQAVRSEGPAGYAIGNAFGLRIQEVPLFREDRLRDDSTGTDNHGEFWLTYPSNLLWGIKREVEVFREFKPKKDAIEYTVYTRVGVQVENPDAAVVVYNTTTAVVA